MLGGGRQRGTCVANITYVPQPGVDLAAIAANAAVSPTVPAGDIAGCEHPKERGAGPPVRDLNGPNFISRCFRDHGNGDEGNPSCARGSAQCHVSGEKKFSASQGLAPRDESPIFRHVLINLVPEFLAVLQASDREAAFEQYLSSHRAVLSAYWHNFVLDLKSRRPKR